MLSQTAVALRIAPMVVEYVGEAETGPHTPVSRSSRTPRRCSTHCCRATSRPVCTRLCWRRRIGVGPRAARHEVGHDNADDLIKALTLAANRERQAQITQEISEIVAVPTRWPTRSKPRRKRRGYDCCRQKRPRRVAFVRNHGPRGRRRVPAWLRAQLLNALHAEITFGALAKTLTLEVAQHLATTWCVASPMQPTDGLVRGQDVTGHRCLDLGARRRRRQGQCSTPWATASTNGYGRTSSTGPSTASRRPSPTWSPAPRCWRPVLKVVDLLTPYVRGGKIALFGGAGVGKTVLIQEMIKPQAPATSVAPRCSAEWVSAPVRVTTCGSSSRRQRAQGTPPWCSARWTSRLGTRMRVALSALTMAEFFRDEQGQDVLLFIDNIFRFTQAGSEVSTLRVVCLRPWVTSRRWPTRWVSSRSASPRPVVARSPRCRPCTCPPTTTPTRRRPPRSPTWTPPPSSRVRCSPRASSPRWIRWHRPRRSCTPAWSATSTTALPRRSSGSCSATRISRTSSPSSVSTSCPKRTRCWCTAPVRSSAS
jgi:F-type H+-transporting ATPase subunit beta